MPKLVWDKVGERLYETGASKGVLYVQDGQGTYGSGVAWNGLTAVRQSPDGAEETPLYADNIKYLSLRSAENFRGTIEAYTYPDEFAECDGSAEVEEGLFLGQQPRKAFGMVYSTILGNDTQHNDYGEKIHLIYGAHVSPTERAYETVNNDPSAITFSWEFTTTPEQVEGFKPTAYVVVDSTKVAPEAFQALKDTLYGNETEEAKLPSVSEVVDLVKTSSTPA